MSSAIQELLRLPVEERVEAINILWESLEDQRDDLLELTQEEREELDRRLDDAERNPGFGCTWEELRAKLLAKR